ncbi:MULTISPECIES: endonuclease/exonuclease/phosphatase family protein [unclassified Crossiella]|uniref:endonuclease/exonuclease/phosphatase family protein n=1 Tax=unclassified Crossiella TaxID=2620835 RepID=UPI001FFEABC6|nr:MULTISPECIES: endonuclease/exonuclease/phosphatase family protein [unclassified Crossiella]MCK2245414.1 endonuclease/exonuclease/phosphatase family protein [Crossiella sp. S99.2]MCK2259066.1 endonuclease/exonuclease/phosphatase family protein [Crossiella sp. S99.1]
MIRFATLNLFNYRAKPQTVEQARRQEDLAALVRVLEVQVLAVQELLAPGPDSAGEAAALLAGFAEAAGLSCHHHGGAPAVAVGQHGYHVGLAWAEGITPVPGGWWPITDPDFHHGLALAALNVGASVPVVHGSVHLTPMGRSRRVDEGERVQVAITRAYRGWPTLVGGDFNSVSAAPTLVGPGLADPDPYTGRCWADSFAQYCHLIYRPDGTLVWSADRRPTLSLVASGLHDAAVALGAPWQATVGHWPGGDHSPARLDHIWCGRAFAGALRGYRVQTAAVRWSGDSGGGLLPRVLHPDVLTDHRLVLLSYDPMALSL